LDKKQLSVPKKNTHIFQSHGREDGWKEREGRAVVPLNKKMKI